MQRPLFLAILLASMACADIVIFDPATFSDPHHYAEGFSDVIVNGGPLKRSH